MKAAWLPLNFFFAVALLSGCPVSNTSKFDGGSLNYVGRSCNVDAECGNLRCDKVRRQCICLSDESCLSADSVPRFCNNYTGLCVTEITGCTGDADCGETEFCDSSTRSCRPLKSFCETCTDNRECGGANDNCVADAELNQKFCGKACVTDVDCPRGASCEDKDGAKQCWPESSPLPGQLPHCSNFKGCTPDALRTCNVTADCGDLSQRCDPARGKCVAVDQVCPFGTSCDPRNKICVADCSIDADCGAATLRCSNKICEPVGECTTDVDCPANKVCTLSGGQSVGQCMPFCQQDKDCPLGKTCQKVGERYRCEGGCSTQQNCPLDQRCNMTNHQCEGPMVGGKSVCQGTVACGGCEVCDPTKLECQSAKAVFPYCRACSSPAECSGGLCVTLIDNQSYCARACGGGQECPQGFVCLTTNTGQQACVPADRNCQGKCL
ncbi:MAG: hypothetical protein K1X64_11280 [Myxococcaceae bacterium]|nr:hypothetical protein [Myxococcaceae bacterium]